jgi:hypothetical protein
MNEVNLAGLVFLKPIFSFLIIFIVMYALLAKSKLLGDDKFINLFISFIFSSIFVAATDVSDVVLQVIPWFSLLIVLLFFILIFASFIGKQDDIAGKGLGWFFIIVLIIMFLISGFFQFENDIKVIRFFNWALSSSIFATLIFIGIAGLVGWVITKGK